MPESNPLLLVILEKAGRRFLLRGANGTKCWSGWIDFVFVPLALKKVNDFMPIVIDKLASTRAASRHRVNLWHQMRLL